ncbi:hypothetical protein [Actinomadura rupiterrae]|uniref:hypothetical protein n=1 Tax=Actinomadura rupiterrae TaxID=559627 RepID=UPI0020A3B061|nr:hypothetical protein [Actinomadura rupiterrae]MCP2342295.1 hypothetical protein [Actinomadura rupiterrae]
MNGHGPLLGYLTSIEIEDGYPLPLRDGITAALPEPEARARALQSTVAEYGNLVHILHRDERSTLEARYHDDGAFIWFRLAQNQRPDAPAVPQAAIPARSIPDPPEPDPDEPFPPALTALNRHQHASGLGDVDFELLDAFSAGAVTGWTDDPEAEREFRVFGVTGDGGSVAFWLVHPDRPMEEQPVVCLGGEGDVGPVASDLCDLLHLLAAGVGPFEAVTYGPPFDDAVPNPAIADIATAHLGPRDTRTAEAILADATNRYSDIKDRLRSSLG